MRGQCLMPSVLWAVCCVCMLVLVGVRAAGHPQVGAVSVRFPPRLLLLVSWVVVSRLAGPHLRWPLTVSQVYKVIMAFRDGKRLHYKCVDPWWAMRLAPG